MADHPEDSHAATDDVTVADRLPEGTKPFGLVGYFDTPGELYQACEELRDAGFKMDAHTPFPVHGLEKAMGLGPSKLPYIVLAGAFIGGLSIFALMWWVDNVEYPQNFSGKPHFAWQAYIPVTFEITVLLSAFGAFFGLWGLNKLPQFFHPVMRHPNFTQASDDKFFVSVENVGPHTDLERAREILGKLGIHELLEVAP